MKEGVEQRREKIRQKWDKGWYSKEFTDVLGPLYGYLLKQVGRPWDKVFSEICKNLPANSTNTSHVRDHVNDFVEQDVVIVGGTPFRKKGRSFEKTYDLFRYGRPYALYVHPETKLLCKWRSRKKPKKAPPEKTVVPVPGKNQQQYHKIKGIWYLVELADIKESPAVNSFTSYVYDAAYQEDLNGNKRRRLYGGNLVGVSKRQLNKREIAKAGLRNEEPTKVQRRK